MDKALETQILEAKINERRKQAKDRRIREKAAVIAKYLGNGHETTDEGEYTFKGSNFLIKDNYKVYHDHDGPMAGFGTNIYYKGQQVYDEGGGQIYSYIPGDWEKTLNQLYSKAEKAKGQKEREEKSRLKKGQEKKEEELKTKWGL